MALHEQSIGATSDWYTPGYIFDALGCVFDLDVASPGRSVVPWIPTTSHNLSNGLEREWCGDFVWMNAPFGGRNGLVPWLEKFVAHDNGIALTPDRTSAPWWQKYAAQMDMILFVSPKIKFVGANGLPGRSPAQGTSLMALGRRGCAALFNAHHAGLGIIFETRKYRM